MDSYKSAKYVGPAPKKQKPQFDVDTRFAMDMKPMVHHNAGETEYNKPAKTKAARSKMADKPPKISPRKAYQD
jgi:hypothetical protein